MSKFEGAAHLDQGSLYLLDNYLSVEIITPQASSNRGKYEQRSFDFLCERIQKNVSINRIVN